MGEHGRPEAGAIQATEVAGFCLLESERLYRLATAEGLTLRLIGSLAVFRHCDRYGSLLTALGRRAYRDIDFVAPHADSDRLRVLFEGEGYVTDRQVLQSNEWGVKRLIFHHPDIKMKVDVFLDELQMSHRVDFRNRLHLDAPTVSLADLVLSKLQIHELTDNDMKDLAILVAEHDVEGGGAEAIDTAHIARIMGRDWPFYYTAVKNLSVAAEAVASYATLPPAVRELVRSRLQHLLDRIEREPKSRRWKLRARIGTRMQWYEEVGDVDR